MRSTKEYAAPSILAIGIVFLVIGFVQQGFTFSMNLPEAVRPVFERLPKRFLRGTPVAAFDTSYKMSWWLRHFTAAKRLTRELRKLGGRRIVPPETFHVVGREGPLYEGEIERARAWAALILARLRQNATWRTFRSAPDPTAPPGHLTRPQTRHLSSPDSPQMPGESGETLCHTETELSNCVNRKEHPMAQTELQTAYVLSTIIVILAILVSAGGLFLNDLYRDNALVTAGWFGNDLVTLVVAVPVLVGALILSMRGSPRARLVWLGMLGYTLYNYAFYLFGAAFNRFFLLYVALFALSIFALIFALTQLDVNEVGRRFRAGTPARWISSYMLFVAVGLGGVEVAQSLSFVVTGQVPQVIVDVAHPTGVIFALDLSLVVPFFVLGAIWLWQRRPWGYVLGAVLNVKGAVYMLALTAASVSAAGAGFPEAAAQIPIWGFLLVGSLVASGLLLGNLQSAQSGEKGEFR